MLTFILLSQWSGQKLYKQAKREQQSGQLNQMPYVHSGHDSCNWICLLQCTQLTLPDSFPSNPLPTDLKGWLIKLPRGKGSIVVVWKKFDGLLHDPWVIQSEKNLNQFEGHFISLKESKLIYCRGVWRSLFLSMAAIISAGTCRSFLQNNVICCNQNHLMQKSASFKSIGLLFQCVVDWGIKMHFNCIPSLWLAKQIINYIDVCGIDPLPI